VDLVASSTSGLVALVAAVVLATGPRLSAWGTEKLGRYAVDPDTISVSGISSGGYMAQQYHVAHSKQIMGVGILAAGPWDCADTQPGLPPAEPAREAEQSERLRALARTAKLDPDLAEKFLNFIVTEVIRHHEAIRKNSA